MQYGIYILKSKLSMHNLKAFERIDDCLTVLYMSKSFDNMFHEMFNCSKTNECLTVMIVCSDRFGNCVGDNAVCWNTLGYCSVPLIWSMSKANG